MVWKWVKSRAGLQRYFWNVKAHIYNLQPVSVLLWNTEWQVLNSFDVSSGLNVFHTESVEITPPGSTTKQESTTLGAGDASVSSFSKEKMNEKIKVCMISINKSFSVYFSVNRSGSNRNRTPPWSFSSSDWLHHLIYCFTYVYYYKCCCLCAFQKNKGQVDYNHFLYSKAVITKSKKYIFLL